MNHWMCMVIMASCVHAAKNSHAQDDAPWERMDYGPFLSAAIEVSPDNIACKGIAIPLDRDGHHAMLFDSAELRWAAGWKGDFVKLKGIVYDGPHGTWPEIDGEAAWFNPPGPGIATGESVSFEDPRAIPYGPLPESLGRFRGIARTGDGVILGYTIGDMMVLEAPGCMVTDELACWLRWISMPRMDQPVHLSIAAVEAGTRLVRGEDCDRLYMDDRLLGLVSICRQADSIDGAGSSTWIRDGRLGVTINPGSDHRFDGCIVLCELDDESEVADAKAAIDQLQAPDDLEARWRRPDHALWSRPITLAGARNVFFDQSRDIQAIHRNPGDPRMEMRFDAEPDESPMLVDRSGTPMDLSRTDANDSMLLMIADRSTAPAPIAGWNCDEGSGTHMKSVVDSQADLHLDGVTWRRGIRGRSLDFDGTARATWTRGNDIEFMDTPLTISAWIHTTKDGTIFSQAMPDGPWVPDGKTLFIRGGRLCYDVGWVGVACTDIEVADGSWHHVAMSWEPDEQEVVLYVDGTEQARTELGPGEPVQDQVIRFGFTAENFPSETWFSGFMDGIRIHDQALDVEDVRAVAAESGEPIARAYALGGSIDARWELDADTDDAMLVMPPTEQEAIGELLQWSGPLSRINRIGGRSDTSELLTRPFQIDRISWPEENPWNSWMRFGDFDFLDDGDAAAISTWSGDVWMVKGLDRNLDQLRWRRIASGLSQPLGLATRGDEILVVGRDQITRLVDVDGDDETDRYEAFNVDTMNSPHFHEPASGLQVGPGGYLYYIKAARHAKKASHPQHGTLIRVSPDGAGSEIIASGFRAPNGVAVDQDGTAWGSDQEGHWMPANRINRITSGSFHGNNWSGSQLDEPERTAYDRPLLWLHPTVDRSPSAQVRVPEGTWGPLSGKLLGISYGTGEVYLVTEDEVEGVHQGAMVPLPIEMPTGIMRGRFNSADGHLYVAGLFGWSSDKTQPGGFYRVRKVNQPLGVPLQARATTDGIVLEFSDPITSSREQLQDAFKANAWNYRWASRYGSDRYDIRTGEPGITELEIHDVHLLPGNRSVLLHIRDMQPAMQVHVDWNLDFEKIGNRESFVHMTIHELGKNH